MTQPVDTTRRSVLHPAILRVCKQLQDEGSAVYSKNTFAIKERTTWTHLYPQLDLSRIANLGTIKPNIKHIELAVTLVNYRPLGYLAADQGHLDKTWSFEHTPELVFAYTSRNHPPLNGNKWPFFLARTDPDNFAADLRALVMQPEYRLANAAYMRLDHRGLFNPPVGLGVVNVETLALACAGIERWMFGMEFADGARAAAFRTYPLAALLASVVAVRPPVKKIILRKLGAAKGELEALMVYLRGGAATPSSVSLWHSLSIWNCAGTLGLERRFPWHDGRTRWGNIAWTEWSKRAWRVLLVEYEWVFEA
ncbi:uncharacterized protein BDZ99DRAFT_457551 [Mytilinidion resinicola]|uniref:Uncharacterized protein n=1 Tax=Mytilinidion resinicola TaxID=574789 RepID=A0A6A6ZCF2_9PEZI|nr:uncharacterized protein BDZ99DRAFT_457551 [Mytilinidion resinicola]KAF2817985.1 hypothetical protein BDZ99DRAFT_457551 [Mytilinidion resinicola]